GAVLGAEVVVRRAGRVEPVGGLVTRDSAIVADVGDVVGVLVPGRARRAPVAVGVLEDPDALGVGEAVVAQDAVVVQVPACNDLRPTVPVEVGDDRLLGGSGRL